MKIVITFISVLLIVVNSVLLLFQYNVYSSSLADSEQSFFYEQEIELKFKTDKMVVKQHFSNLPKDETTISWPILSENRSCNVSKNNSCDRLSEDLTTFLEGETSKQSISYEIPLANGLEDGKTLTEFMAKLDDGGVSYTTLHITDELKRGGMWVSGLPIIGETSLDLIDYTLAFGAGKVTDLYWQKEVLPVIYEDNYFTFYSKKVLPEELLTQLADLHLPGSEHMSVLLTENKHGINPYRIIVTGDDPNSIEYELVVKTILTQYGLEDNLLLAEVVGSYLVNRPIGSEKAVWVYETLNNYFTEDQLSTWKSSLTENEKRTGQDLDALLSEIIGLKTSFFAFNLESGKEHFPLLFEDSRTVYINELQKENMKVLFKDGRVLYAAEPLLTDLGYSFTETNKGLYIQNASRSFRFPVQEPFYVLNEKRYEAMSDPFEKIGSDYYVEEAWLIRLFLLEIEKQEKRINITQSALF
ncbi:hypothetical protein [Psychrobacillus sp.]|uniref:hypothetical protein n=1 Tax=Psychrobacillus sp. TaxID=1871623 RepID=UPI0028BD3243|nr:hypothetical protein [Psychrobacillus sp.]